jgi:putative transposase
VTHLPRAKRVVIAIIDLVSRYWIEFLVLAEETSTQVRIVFTRALQAQGLLSEALARTADGSVPIDVDDDARPILLAVSDNGGADDSGSTRQFMAFTRSLVTLAGRALRPIKRGSKASSDTSRRSGLT